MNTRHFVSNIPEKEVRDIYFGFYVKRGEAGENRIKEVKKMCFLDRLYISTMVYKFFLRLKRAINNTQFEKSKKWQISSIRTHLLKIGATIKILKTKVHYSL